MWNLSRSLLASTRVSRSLFSSSSLSLSSPFRTSPSLSSPSSSSSPSSPPTRATSSTESFATATSAAYEERMYEAWKNDRSSVHSSWDAYFSAVDAGLPPHLAHNVPHNLGYDHNVKVPLSALSSSLPSSPSLAPSSSPSPATPVSAIAIKDSVRMFNLARAFQRNGHHMATLDPLNRTKEEKTQPKFVPRDLDAAYWGFQGADLDRPVFIEGNPPVLSLEGRSYVTVREAIAELRRVYCGNIGVEFTHLKEDEMIQFIRKFMETPPRPYTKEERMLILDRLAWSDMFERFLDTKYGGAKRFGLEGCEALIPGLKALIDEAAEHGCEDIVVGMPHRGRLNTLANVIRKPLPAIFCEFKGMDVSEGSGSGDVKYHLGTSYKRRSRTGKKISLYLSANPSHLEAVNPVVSGRTRAMQYEKADHNGEKVCAVLMHGDAAFAGQGVVYESLHLNDLPSYTTHGSIHVVVNNQIGFTTDPLYSRSTPHPTDVAKNVNAPIVHVNADDVESVVRVFTLAAEFRQRFREDFVIDLVGYRRYGHNEIDPADMTQPLMYHLIAKHPPVLKLYTEFLLKEGICTQAEIDQTLASIKSHLESGFEEAKTYTSLDTEWRESRWKDLRQIWQGADKPRPTNITKENLIDIGKHLVTVPAGFTLHKQIKKIMEKKEEMFRTGKGFDWGTAEALAFGSLLKEGMHVRLSGQDVERGTFSHRHAVLHDQVNGSRFTPLDNVRSSKSHLHGFSINNSSLSEFAVLGFELGYSLEDPNFLVLWEAQFGDFANGAQIIIDQFISSGEQKWKRQSGLVLLLPHGYDGQGPEHSSARLERFLAMTDSQPDEFPDLSTLEKRQAFVHGCNWQVCNVTNPANYFHLLRRQLHRPFRKPLCLMSPKNLLRHPLCVSSIEEFTDTELFTRVYGETFEDEIVAPNDVKRLVLCTGKIYYELLENRRKENVRDVALVRVEQLAPFPFDLIVREIEKYPNAGIVWCQEEPQNMGAWHYMYFHLQTALKNSAVGLKETLFIGRPSAASPASGNYKVHGVEQKQIIDHTLLLKK